MTNQLSIDSETQIFELLQRQSKFLSASTLVPKEFQNNMANCAIGLNIAKRLGADPFMVLQNIDIIHGRPSFRATFLIAMVNASGRFSPLQFEMSGEGPTRGCVAKSTVKETGESVEGPQITMAMAKAEGWSTKQGSKWITMPELMLRYRAAAFFSRIYAPDITLGMQTSEEEIDIEPPRQASGRVVTQNLPEPTPLVARASTRHAAPVEVAPEPEPEPEATAPTEKPDENPAPNPTTEEKNERAALVESVKTRLKEIGSTMGDLGAKCREANLLHGTTTLRDIPLDALTIIAESIPEILAGTFGQEAAQ